MQNFIDRKGKTYSFSDAEAKQLLIEGFPHKLVDNHGEGFRHVTTLVKGNDWLQRVESDEAKALRQQIAELNEKLGILNSIPG